MGPQGAVEIVYRRELPSAADPAARKAELVEEYTERFANPYEAAERGYVDDVIDPADTRTQAHRRARHAALQARGAARSASTATCRCRATQLGRTRRAHRRGGGGHRRRRRGGVARAPAAPAADGRRPAGGSRAGGGPSRSRCAATAPGECLRPRGVACRSMELTTVADDEAVLHDGTARSAATTGLAPDTDVRARRASSSARSPRRRASASPRSPRSTTCTSARPSAASSRASRRPDLHDGAGREPYPEVMNRGAIAEIAALDPDVVVVKGDLTSDGHPGRVRRFLDCYGPRSATGCIHVRGNHDAYHGEVVRRPTPPVGRRCPASRLAVLDTVDPRQDHRRRERPSSSSGSTSSRPTPTGPCSCSATTTSGTPSPTTRPDDLLRHQPRRLRAAGRRGRPAARARRLLRRPHPPQPRPPLLGHGRRAVGRGGLRQGLPRRVGRVPGVRRRHPPGAPPHLRARGPGVDREDPRHVRRRCTPTTRSAPSRTAASPSPCDAAEERALDEQVRGGRGGHGQGGADQGPHRCRPPRRGVGQPLEDRQVPQVERVRHHARQHERSHAEPGASATSARADRADDRARRPPPPPG